MSVWGEGLLVSHKYPKCDDFIKVARVETWSPIQACPLLRQFPQTWPLAGHKPAWDLGVADTGTAGQLLLTEPLKAPSSIHHPLSSWHLWQSLPAAPVLELQEAQLLGGIQMEESQLQICRSIVNSGTLERHLPCPSDKGEGAGVLLKYKLLLTAETKAGLGHLLSNSSQLSGKPPLHVNFNFWNLNRGLCV